MGHRGYPDAVRDRVIRKVVEDRRSRHDVHLEEGIPYQTVCDWVRRHLAGTEALPMPVAEQAGLRSIERAARLADQPSGRAQLSPRQAAIARAVSSKLAAVIGERETVRFGAVPQPLTVYMLVEFLEVYFPEARLGKSQLYRIKNGEVLPGIDLLFIFEEIFDIPYWEFLPPSRFGRPPARPAEAGS